MQFLRAFPRAITNIAPVSVLPLGGSIVVVQWLILFLFGFAVNCPYMLLHILVIKILTVGISSEGEAKGGCGLSPEAVELLVRFRLLDATDDSCWVVCDLQDILQFDEVDA